MVVIVAIIVPHSSIPYKPKVRLPTLHAGCIMVCVILRMYYCTLSPKPSYTQCSLRHRGNQKNNCNRAKAQPDHQTKGSADLVLW